jgi:hypothetical protein
MSKTLKELLKNNIELAQDSIYFDDQNTKINELFTEIDRLDINAQQKSIHEILVNLLGKYVHLPEILFTTALKLDDKEIFEEAIFFYRLSNIILPNPKAINNIAIIYANTNRIKYGLEILEAGLQQFPEDETISENLKILSSYK